MNGTVVVMAVKKAYQCDKCKHSTQDDFSDKLICLFGFWRGSGEAYLCKEVFEPIEDGGSGE